MENINTDLKLDNSTPKPLTKKQTNTLHKQIEDYEKLRKKTITHKKIITKTTKIKNTKNILKLKYIKNLLIKNQNKECIIKATIINNKKAIIELKTIIKL